MSRKGKFPNTLNILWRCSPWVCLRHLNDQTQTFSARHLRPRSGTTKNWMFAQVPSSPDWRQTQTELTMQSPLFNVISYLDEPQATFLIECRETSATLSTQLASLTTISIISPKKLVTVTKEIDWTTFQLIWIFRQSAARESSRSMNECLAGDSTLARLFDSLNRSAPY